MGTCGSYSRAKRSGGGTPPRAIADRRRKTVSPDPGQRIGMSRPAMTSGFMSRRRALQGRIASIFAADAPQGRLRNVEGGFLQRFPPSCRGPRSFTPFNTHTPRRWGSIGSRGVAADRDRRGWGRSYGIQRCQPRGYEYGYGNPCERASSTG